MKESMTRRMSRRHLALLALGTLCTASVGGAQTTPPSAVPSGSLLTEAPNFTATRVDKALVVVLKRPHRVLSTSALTGGVSTSVGALVNHQSLEPAGHDARADHIIALGRDGFHRETARALGLDPERTAILGTAANLNYVAWRHLEFRDLRVDAYVTAGVEGNATRAGDPTRWFEGDEGFTPIADRGTINTIVIINKPLAIGAEVRAAITAVEAKSAALGELAVGSRQSSHLATGTGTDQLILATVIDSTHRQLEDPGSHMKLGELIGTAVREATREALRWQNGLESSYTRNVGRTLARFGLPEDTLLVRLRGLLPKKEYDLLLGNRIGVMMEPRLSAATFGYATLLDRLQYGTLPEGLAADVLRDQAATVAVALSARPDRWWTFREQLAMTSNDRMSLYVQAVALGWLARWAP